MASSSEALHDKTVTGYPAQANHIATGYPAPASAAVSSTNSSNNEYAFPYSFRPVQTASFVYRPAGSTASYTPPFRNSFLQRICFFSFVIVSLMALICFTAYLVFRPHLPEFRVVSATVSHLNLTQSELTASWLFNLYVRNPNEKLSISYERLQASVFCGEELELARTQLPPLFQDRNNESTIQFQLGVIGEYVNDDVVKKISKERDRGSVEFGVRVFTLARFTSGVWRTREHVMRIYCDSVRIGNFTVNGTGTSLGQSEKCDVYL